MDKQLKRNKYNFPIVTTLEELEVIEKTNEYNVNFVFRDHDYKTISREQARRYLTNRIPARA